MIGQRRIAVILQARRGSSRLRDKVLLPLGKSSVLKRTIERCQNIPGIDAVICATTDNPEDEAIAKLAKDAGAWIHRGSVTDVLARYHGAASQYPADIFMRVTSDCPFIDPAICRAVIDLLIEKGADYAANNMSRLFPHGLDCEAFTPQALERAEREALDPYDREHVTPWLRRAPAIRRAYLIGPGWPADRQRWTLDYPEDYETIRAIDSALENRGQATMQDILSVIAARPELAAANARHRISATPPPGAPIALFRIAAGPKIGLGHAMRSAALTARLLELGWDCRWSALPEAADFLADLAPTGRITRLAPGAPAASAGDLAAAHEGCNWLIVDDYAAEAEFCAAFRRSSGARIALLDDLADRAIDADLIFNPTPGFAIGDYKAAAGASLHLGPDYALLRRQFAVARQEIPDRATDGAHPIRRLLIAFGGIDPLNGTELALAAALASDIPTIEIVLGRGAPHDAAVAAAIARAHSGAKDRKVSLHRDLADMAGLMRACDLVIGAPGTATFERCCLGLPSLLVGIAENQRANAAFLEASGAAIIVGFLTEQSREDIEGRLREALRALDGDPERRRSLAERAAQFCDGRGVQRTILALLPTFPLRDGAPALRLRLAEARDEALLLDWQKVPETRRFAHNPAIPTPAEHRRWFRKKIAADGDWLLIGESGGDACGFLRLDQFGEDRGRPQFLVSLAAAPGHYRRGVGSALLAAARALAPGAHFHAQILPENSASIALFTAAGYCAAADGYYHARARQD